jgi:hypothetical protein
MHLPVCCVRDEHDVLVPAHQVSLPRRAAHNQALNARRDLLLNQAVIAEQVNAPVGKVGRLNGRDQAQLIGAIRKRNKEAC